jgi:catechol 2,3-dioxygenase-like lactoylglutathione lyase family enzyme
VAVRTSGLDHVHVWVGDVEATLRFYRAVFGAEESFRVGERLVFVRLPDAPGVIALDGRREEERNPEHVGLRLAEGEDYDGAIAAVERAGGQLLERGEHVPGVPYAYVADPDGNVIEL